MLRPTVEKCLAERTLARVGWTRWLTTLPLLVASPCVTELVVGSVGATLSDEASITNALLGSNSAPVRSFVDELCR